MGWALWIRGNFPHAAYEGNFFLTMILCFVGAKKHPSMPSFIHCRLSMLAINHPKGKGVDLYSA
jgi:hypothetical protein